MNDYGVCSVCGNENAYIVLRGDSGDVCSVCYDDGYAYNGVDERDFF